MLSPSSKTLLLFALISVSCRSRTFNGKSAVKSDPINFETPSEFNKKLPDLYFKFYERSLAAYKKGDAVWSENKPFENFPIADADFLKSKWKKRPQSHFEAPEFYPTLLWIKQKLAIASRDPINSSFVKTCVSRTVDIFRGLPNENDFNPDQFKIYYDEAWLAILYGMHGVQKCVAPNFYEVRDLEGTTPEANLSYALYRFNATFDQNLPTLQFLVPTTQGDIAPIDFIDSRPLPIYTIGLTDENKAVDGASDANYLTPLEFVSHDLLHAKSQGSSDFNWMSELRSRFGLLSDTKSEIHHSKRLKNEIKGEETNDPVTLQLVKGIMQRRIRFKDITLACLDYKNEVDPEFRKHSIDYLNKISHEGPGVSFGPDDSMRMYKEEGINGIIRFELPGRRRVTFHPMFDFKNIQEASAAVPLRKLSQTECFTDPNPFRQIQQL
jgi:hypothetical protein